MRRPLLVLLATLLLLLGLAAPAAGSERIRASGTFTTELFLPTFTVTPVGASACRVTVQGALTFTGTVEGTATGTTTALVFAPCEDVATSPPGTAADVFRSRLTLDGTVDGRPVTADITWVGTTRAGGDIEAVMVVDGDGLQGLLRVEAVVGEGGTYRGTLALA